MTLYNHKMIECIPISLLNILNTQSIILPYYHMVSDNDVLHVKYLYKNKSIKQFTDDIDFLLRHYEPIELSKLINNGKRFSRLRRKGFLLSFDDGFRENYDLVMPILLKKGVPATFFINSAFLDNKALCYSHKASILCENVKNKGANQNLREIQKLLKSKGINYNSICTAILSVSYRERNKLDELAQIIGTDFKRYLNQQQPYLTSEQIYCMINNGFTIGSHSIDHPYYADLSLDEQIKQTEESTKEIRSRFGLKYSAFAFPHSDSGVTKEYFNRVNNEGLVEISFGTGGMLDDEIETHYQRFSLERPLQPAKRVVPWHYLRRIYRKMIHLQNLWVTTGSGRFPTV